jgi:hypothetical protein
MDMEAAVNDRDRRVREIAYFLWMEEGFPEGEAERHWHAAEALYDSEDAERKSIEGEPPGEPLEASEGSTGSGVSAIPGRRKAASGRTG